ncbi:MAG: hydrogenase nickel incorporation protein HypB [Cyanobacteria bacterium P01_H01_bin.121]
MCVTCGCSDGAETTFTYIDSTMAKHQVESLKNEHTHTHQLADGTVVTHQNHELHQAEQQHDHGHHSHDQNGHSHQNGHHHNHNHQHGSQTLTLEQNLLAKNDLIAAQNRGWLQGRQTTALNLVSSPGAGKTTLLVRTIQDLQAELPIVVIEGDQETAQDAERIAATGCPTMQVNTGTGCHLEANMVQQALQTLQPPLNSLVLIENVGNLVCPALFDLGEHAKVVMLSVTEGEDKPIKYPHMFQASQVMVLTKVDLLPYVPFDVDRCLDYARQVNPDLKIFQVSATSGAGLEDWYGWIQALSDQAQ